jgi:hypothetical protein
MNADAAALDALGKMLIQRAADLGYLGRTIESETWGVNWTCAKADRYAAAMQARQAETRRLSNQMSELGTYLRSRAAKLDAAAAAPEPEAKP